MKDWLRVFKSNGAERGFSLLEYCAGAAVILVTVWAALNAMGTNMKDLLGAIGKWAADRKVEIEGLGIKLGQVSRQPTHSVSFEGANMPVRLGYGSAVRQKPTQTLVASAVISAGLVAAALLVANSSAGKAELTPTSPMVVAEFDTINIPVPAELVPEGRRLREVAFRSVAYPKHQIPGRALLSLDGYIDGVALANLPAGLPLFPENLGMGASSSNPVMEKIPPGMRAMTIRVDATAAVEGWAAPGSVVDVLLVEKERTAVIAEKVTILSAERSTVPVDGAEAPSVPSTVTLLVTQDQCLTINTAIPLGRIAFALRGTRDQESWKQNSFTPDRLQNKKTQAIVTSASVNGFVEMDRQGQKRRYVLQDRKWIPSDVIPEGFLAGRTRDE